MPLLFLFCLYLNFYLFNCEELPKFEDTSDLPMQPSYKYDSDTERRFEELKEKIQKDYARRKANIPPNFGMGLLDYDISHLDFFGTTKAKTDQNDQNKKGKEHKKPKGSSTADNEGFLDYDITKMFWDKTPKIGDLGKITPLKFYIPTLPGHGVELKTTVKSTTTADPWKNFDNFGVSTNPPVPDIDEYSDKLKGLNITFKTPKLNVYTRPPDYSFSRPSYPFSVPAWTDPSPDFYPVKSTLDPTYIPGSPSTWIGPLTTLFPGLTARPGFPTEYSYTNTKATTTTAKTSSSSISTSPRPPIPIPRSQAITVRSESRMSFNYMPEFDEDLAWLKVKPRLRNRG